MLEMFLIRHCEAEGNLYRRMQGNYDGGITDLGAQQLAALARRFSTIPLDAVYSSDLCRAMETGAALCRPKGLPLYVDSRLREVNVGAWEDLPFGTVAATYPEQLALYFQNPIRWNLPGADSFSAVADRAVAALSQIAARHNHGRVAVCAHGFLILAVLCKLFYGLEQFDLAGISINTAVTRLTWENGEFSLSYAHDGTHLPAALWRSRPYPQDLWIRPMASDAAEEYIRYRRDAWEVVYGNLTGFDGGGFWLDAQRTIGADPNAMVVGYLGRTPVGMIQLSPSRDMDRKVGYIPFLYLRESFRHRGLGIQLIGHAVSFYRNLGRTRLQLSVAPTNENALKFYRKYGFYQVRKQRGRFGHLLLLEKDIAPPRPPKDVEIIKL